MSQVTITLSALLNSSVSDVFSKAKNYIKQFKDSINSSMFSTLGAAQMAGNAIGYVKNTLGQVMAEAKQFEKTGIKFGVNPSEVAKLGKLAEETMTPVRSLYKGLNQLKSAAAEALANPNSQMGEAFKQLGISAADLSNGLINPNQLLGLVSDKLNNISDDAQRQQAIMEIFKANGYALAGVLEMTSDEQKNLLEGHSTMNDLVIGQNAAMEDSWGRFWDSIKVGFSYIGLVLNPLVQILSVLLNVIQLLVTALGGGLWAAIQVVFGALVSIVGVVGLLIGGVLKLNGVFTKLFGMGDDLEKFADGWLEASANITKAGISGGIDAAGKIMDKTQEGMKEDVNDIKRSGRAVVAGYGDEKKKKREGTGTFKDPEQAKKEAEEAKKKAEEQAKADKEEAKKTKEAQHDLDKAITRRRMEAEGASEEEIDKALLMLEITKATTAMYAAQGADRIAAEAKVIELNNQLNKMNEKAAEKAKKEKEKSIDEERKKRKEMLKEQLSLITTVEDIASQLKVQGMKKSGMTEQQIKNAQFVDDLNKAEKLQKEYEAALAKNGGVENADTIALRNEAASAQGKVLLSKGEMDLAGRNSMGVMADSMRRIGGGGTAITTGSNSAIELSKKQLASINSMDENIKKLVGLVEKAGIPTSQRGREMRADELANAGLGSDNKPTK